ncbi:MAG: hypothetical protein IJJ41_04160 [Clostridia bacterium]|nr:hypothetical protein [Clostridia bacterium]
MPEANDVCAAHKLREGAALTRFRKELIGAWRKMMFAAQMMLRCNDVCTSEQPQGALKKRRQVKSKV